MELTRLKKQTFSIIYKAFRSTKKQDDFLAPYLGDALNTISHYGVLRRLVKRIYANEENDEYLRSEAFRALIKIADSNRQRTRMVKSALENNSVSFRRRLLFDAGYFLMRPFRIWCDLITRECLIDRCPVVSHVAISEIRHYYGDNERANKIVPLLKRITHKKIKYKGKLRPLCPFDGPNGLPTERKPNQCPKYRGQESCQYERLRYEAALRELEAKGYKMKYKGVTKETALLALKSRNLQTSINAAYHLVAKGYPKAFPVLLRRVTQIAKIGLRKLERKLCFLADVDIPLTGIYELRNTRLISPLKRIISVLPLESQLPQKMRALYELASAGDRESLNKLTSYLNYPDGDSAITSIIARVLCPPDKRLEAAIWVSEFIIAQGSRKDYHLIREPATTWFKVAGRKHVYRKY